MAAVNWDYWLLVGVKIERWLFGTLQCTSCMLKSIEDNGCSREVGLFFRGVVNSG